MSSSSVSNREGNLEAPTRHPLDWKNPAFYDEAACLHEMERIFDICHGCRRCVSLCQSFPTLFDLVDEGASGELDGVDKKDFWKVVDQCYLCDLCYMTKCPYVPPHPWNLDFPHTMLRAKAIKFKKGEVGAGEKFLASTDVHGQFAGIPVVVQLVNAVNKTALARQALDRTLGVHPKAWMPELAGWRFRWGAAKSTVQAATNGERTPGRVAVFSTCYINYNEPGIGHDLLKVLAHNEIPYVLVEKEQCCGMPKLELGDLEAVERHKNANIPVLEKYAREGYAILSAIPSCTLMFKQELPLMFPGDEAVQRVMEAMWDPFEYLIARHKDGLLRTDFKTALGKVSYHVPCHGRVQKIGRKTEEMFRLIGQTVELKLNTVERCSGHAGTYGVKTPYHPVAMKIGRPVFKAMARDEPDVIASDCALAGHHIAQGMDEAGTPARALRHPLSLLRQAYGLGD
ncbi:(Fe-S)-binding protein [Roseateles violae]|uniref:Heterodisulfide reductase-related iron-sulfur binding cluster n=1 Tax=Roseateles violae TaxID=3058042 RepID=A0ABT8DTB8_9BURK|nr:heterodisulfide reductase-related iron-sulfur binding cluster [Pelomonas sp. PFR6]MDN3920265.1 heterodisulfide reductase-related iron-sulfur binding cluster [Pelomonas sp. PFR6]